MAIADVSIGFSGEIAALAFDTLRVADDVAQHFLPGAAVGGDHDDSERLE